jgi:lipopolysaccharide/colanic/teichoic acid biosynthesis glycosyltransferase
VLVRTADLALLAACTVAGAVLADRLLGQPVMAACGAGLATALVVACALAVGRAWEPVVLGIGPTEFRRLVRANATSAVIVAFAGLALQVDATVRPWVFGVLPAYTALAVAARYALRRWLHQQRCTGRFLLPVLAVGDHRAVADLIARTRADRHFGWTVDGVCTAAGTGPGGSTHIAGVPVVGDLESILTAVRTTGYRVVAVAPGPGWGPRRLHELAWQLEGTRTELAVEPGLMDVAGPRLHITPMDDMPPMVRLSKPRLTGGSRLLKRVFDVVGAAALLAVLAGPMLMVALAVRADGGPALRREPRIGEGGRPYMMRRFRVTRNDDEDPPGELCRALLRFSVDELPQLFDVLAGSMSLVGPRPPQPADLTGADADTLRRLLVRPGMTGLCQVLRGRDQLSWDEAARLDLCYVENWSLILDVSILFRTVSAMVRRDRCSAGV